jgi:hypothetical protein
MSNQINDGGPAFARDTHMDKEIGLYVQQQGMSLRDYFAAAALQGLLAYDGDCSTAIGLAYHTADAMLDWRKKNQ